MSILSQLLHKQITFSQAASQIADDVSKALSGVGAEPNATAAAGAILSDLKQAASNAIDMADSAIGSHILPVSQAVEGALDSFLASVTHGVSIPFNPLLNDAIDRAAAFAKAEADAWALKAKAAAASVQIPPAS